MYHGCTALSWNPPTERSVTVFALNCRLGSVQTMGVMGARCSNSSSRHTRRPHSRRRSSCRSRRRSSRRRPCSPERAVMLPKPAATTSPPTIRYLLSHACPEGICWVVSTSLPCATETQQACRLPQNAPVAMHAGLMECSGTCHGATARPALLNTQTSLSQGAVRLNTHLHTSGRACSMVVGLYGIK